MVKFIHLPVHIWAMTDLRAGQRILLALIHGFTTSGKGLMMSNKALGELLHVSPRTVRRWLSEMDAAGLVKVNSDDGQRVVILSGGVDTAMTGGGGHSPVHHIERIKTKDINHNNGIEMKKVEVDEVLDYMMTLPRIIELKLSRGEVKRMAVDAVSYYEANQWRTSKGVPVTQWRGVMDAWIKRACKDCTPVKRRPAVDVDQLQRDIRWHQRRLDNYEERGQFRQAANEANAIKGIQLQIQRHMNDA